ncbi:PEGA domain-containing protein [Sorangium sp. So ce1078]|uniref:PEGA domain-containing protein n=1 Tax=Sorangium sp. So ce1078 TaxID=3133329 RepID=UPI003F6378E8
MRKPNVRCGKRACEACGFVGRVGRTMLLRSVLCGICLLGALGSGNGLARAAPAPEGSRPAESAVTKAHQQARRAFGARRWAEAEASFEAVLAAPGAAWMTAVWRAEVLGHLGLCELEQGKHREAAEHLGQSLEQDAALNQALVRRFTRGFNTAVEHVGRIYVAAAPPDAEVLLDGEPIGTGATVHELFVEPGTYTLRARLSGHGELSQRVEVAGGMTVGATLRLARAADAPARAPEPSAKTSGRAEPAATPVARPAAPGPWASWPGTLRIAGVAATTAAVSAGAVFMLRASVLDGDIRERIDGLHRDPGWTSGACLEAPQPSACPDLHRMRVQRDRSGALGTALVATGAVVGAVTAASFFLDASFLRPTPARTGLRIVPATTAQQIGVVALGVW